MFRKLKTINRFSLKFAFVVVFFVLLILSLDLKTAFAGINKQLNYQGRINTAAGSSVSNGTYYIKLAIYDVSTGGTCLWTSVGSCADGDIGTTTVSVVNGIFSVPLGGAGQNSLATSSINWDSDELYLGVTVRGTAATPVYDEEMSPRKRLTASVYAFNADMIDGIHATSTAAVANYLVSLDANKILNLYDGGVSSTYATTTQFIVGNNDRTLFSADGNTGYINIGTTTLAQRTFSKMAFERATGTDYLNTIFINQDFDGSSFYTTSSAIRINLANVGYPYGQILIGNKITNNVDMEYSYFQAWNGGGQLTYLLNSIGQYLAGNSTTTGTTYLGSQAGLSGQYISQWSDLSSYLSLGSTNPFNQWLDSTSTVQFSSATSSKLYVQGTTGDFVDAGINFSDSVYSSDGSANITFIPRTVASGLGINSNILAVSGMDSLGLDATTTLLVSGSISIVRDSTFLKTSTIESPTEPGVYLPLVSGIASDSDPGFFINEGFGVYDSENDGAHIVFSNADGQSSVLFWNGTNTDSSRGNLSFLGSMNIFDGLVLGKTSTSTKLGEGWYDTIKVGAGFAQKNHVGDKVGIQFSQLASDALLGYGVLTGNISSIFTNELKDTYSADLGFFTQNFAASTSPIEALRLTPTSSNSMLPFYARNNLSVTGNATTSGYFSIGDGFAGANYGDNNLLVDGSAYIDEGLTVLNGPTTLATTSASYGSWIGSTLGVKSIEFTDYAIPMGFGAGSGINLITSSNDAPFLGVADALAIYGQSGSDASIVLGNDSYAYTAFISQNSADNELTVAQVDATMTPYPFEIMRVTANEFYLAGDDSSNIVLNFDGRGAITVASTTGIMNFTGATGYNFAGSVTTTQLKIGSLNGILQATDGLVSANNNLTLNNVKLSNLYFTTSSIVSVPLINTTNTTELQFSGATDYGWLNSSGYEFFNINPSLGQLNVKGYPSAIASNLSLPISMRNMHIVDGYLYAALYGSNSVDSFRIIDIADPYNPRIVGGQNINDLPHAPAKRVYANGNYAYLTYNTGTSTDVFRILDISDKNNPRVIGGANLDTQVFGGSGEPLYVSGNYVYILGVNISDSLKSDLIIIDVSDPYNPIIISRLTDLPREVWDIKVSGDYAYGCFHDVDTPLAIINVKNKNNPYLISTSSVGGVNEDCWSVDFSGSRLYLGMGGFVGDASNADVFRIVDVSDPYNPVVKGGSDLDFGAIADGNIGGFNFLKISGQYVYALSWGGYFHKIDISSSTAPQMEQTMYIDEGVGVDDARSPLTFDFSGNHLFVGYAPIPSTGESTRYFRVFSMSGINSSGGYFSSLLSGSLKVNNDAIFDRRVNVSDSLLVGSGGIFSEGGLSVISTSSASYFGGSISIATTTSNYKLAINSSNASDYLLQVATTTNQGIFEIRNDGIARFGYDLAVNGTATSTFAGNIQIAQGKNLQVENIFAYSPLNINTDLRIFGTATATGNLVAMGEVKAGSYTLDGVTINQWSDIATLSGSWATSSEQYFWNNTSTWSGYDSNWARNYNATSTFGNNLLIGGNVGINTTTLDKALTVNGQIQSYNSFSSSTFNYYSRFESGLSAPGVSFLSNVGDITLNVGGYGYATSTDYEGDGGVAGIGLVGLGDFAGIVAEGRFTGGIFQGSYGIRATAMGYGSEAGIFSLQNDDSTGIRVSADSVANPTGINIELYDGIYGLRVDNGSSTGYAIFSETGLNYFENNVGIATTTPGGTFGEKLTVVGNSYFQGNATTSGSLHSSEICLGDSCVTNWSDLSSILNIGSSIFNQWLDSTSSVAFNGVTTTDNLYVGGKAIFNGNVGIGTTTPSEKLVVDNGSISSFDYFQYDYYDEDDDATTTYDLSNKFVSSFNGGSSFLGGGLRVSTGAYGYASSSVDYIPGFLSAGLVGEGQHGLIGFGTLVGLVGIGISGGYFEGESNGLDIGVSGNENQQSSTGIEINLNPYLSGSGLEIEINSSDLSGGNIYGLKVVDSSSGQNINSAALYHGIDIDGAWHRGISVNNSSSTQYSIYSTGGLNYFGGNVGIGTTTPTEKLVVDNGSISSFDYFQYDYYDEDDDATTTYNFSNILKSNYRGLDSTLFNGTNINVGVYGSATSTDFSQNSDYKSIGVMGEGEIGVVGKGYIGGIFYSAPGGVGIFGLGSGADSAGGYFVGDSSSIAGLSVSGSGYYGAVIEGEKMTLAVNSSQGNGISIEVSSINSSFCSVYYYTNKVDCEASGYIWFESGDTPFALYAKGGRNYFEGNVGIGTSTPGGYFGEKLTVVGNSYFQGNATTSGSLHSSEICLGDSCVTNWSDLSSILNIGSSIFNQWLDSTSSVAFNGVTTTDNLYVGGKAIFNGNVGIGTTTPSEKLVVDNGSINSFNSFDYDYYDEDDLTTTTYNYQNTFKSNYLTNSLFGLTNTGVYGYATSTDYGMNADLISSGLMGEGQVGVFGLGSLFGGIFTGSQMGIYGLSSGDGGYGGYFSGDNGLLVSGTGHYGAVVRADNQALFVDGDYDGSDGIMIDVGDSISGSFCNNPSYNNQTDCESAGYTWRESGSVPYAIFAENGLNYFGGNVGIGTSTPQGKLVIISESMVDPIFIAGTDGNSAGARAISIGVGAQANGSNSVAIGNASFTNSSFAVAIGSSANASGQSSVALGYASALNNYTLAAGYGAYASGTNSVALGKIKVAGESSFGIGFGDAGIVNYVIDNPNTLAMMGGTIGIATTTPGGYFGEKLTVVGNSYFQGNATTSGSLHVSEICLGNDCLSSWNLSSGSWATSSEQYFWNNTSTWSGYDSNWARNYNATSTFGGNLIVDGRATTTKGLSIGIGNPKNVNLNNGSLFVTSAAEFGTMIQVGRSYFIDPLATGLTSSSPGLRSSKGYSVTDLLLDSAPTSLSGGGKSWARLLLGPISFSEGDSGSIPLIAGIGLMPQTINNGAATVTSTAQLYIQGAMNAVVEDNNYAIFVDDGVSRFDGAIGLATSTPGGTFGEMLTVVGDSYFQGNSTTTGNLTVNGRIQSNDSLTSTYDYYTENYSSYLVDISEVISLYPPDAYYFNAANYGYSTSTDLEGSNSIAPAGLVGIGMYGVVGSGETGGMFVGRNQGINVMAMEDSATAGYFDTSGTNSSYGIEISANGNGSQGLYISSSGEGNKGIYAGVSGNNSIGMEISTTDSLYGLYLYNSNPNTFSIYSVGGKNYFDGAIGIATTTPGGYFGEKLTVVGNSYFQGNATTSGSLHSSEICLGNSCVADWSDLSSILNIGSNIFNQWLDSTSSVAFATTTVSGQLTANATTSRLVAAHCSDTDYDNQTVCESNGATWYPAADHEFVVGAQTGSYGYFPIFDKYFSTGVYGHATSTDTTNGGISSVGVYGNAATVGVAGIGGSLGGFFQGQDQALLTIGKNIFYGSGDFFTNDFSVGAGGNELISVTGSSVGLGQYTAPDEFFGVQPSVDAGAIATARFKTWNNVDQLYLGAGGSIGIATTTPGGYFGEKLTVVGNSYFQGNATTTGRLAVLDVSTLATTTMTYGTQIGNLADGSYLTFTTSNLNDPGNLGFSIGDFPVLSFTNSSEILNNNTGGINNALIIVENIFGTGEDSDFPKFILSSKDISTMTSVEFTFNTTTAELLFTGATKYDFDADVYANGILLDGADYAEYFFTKDIDLVAGEAVCLDITNDNTISRCARQADSNIIGIVSSKPAITGNNKKEYINNQNYKIIGLLGQVPAKVSAENGEIRIGDSLSAATIPGYLAKANAGDSTVGVALEGLASGNGMVNVLISRRNKSLTVEEIESQITERIAQMEIEDEVNILIANAIENLNIDQEVLEAIAPELSLLEEKINLNLDLLSGLIDGNNLNIKNLQSTANDLDLRINNLTQTIKTFEEFASSTNSLFAGLNSDIVNLQAQSLEMTENWQSATSTISYLSSQIENINQILQENSEEEDELTVSETDLSINTLAVSESATFYGTILVKGEAGFEHKVTFYEDIVVKGKIYASKDQAGTAVILANQTSVDVVFGQEYLSAPKVVVNLSDDDETIFVNYKVAKKTNKGFTIILQTPVEKDLAFDWIALAIQSQAPIIQEIIPSAEIVPSDSTVDFQAQVIDADTLENDLKYEWEIISGPGQITGDTNRAIWSLGNQTIAEDTDLEIKLTITDESNIVSSNKTIKIKYIQSEPVPAIEEELEIINEPGAEGESELPDQEEGALPESLQEQSEI